jgi:phage tail sheath protein FI
VRGALDVRFDINDNTQDVLNPRGVDVIRSLPARGIRVWGARTLSSNGLWKYVSVRRLFIFLEHSIYDGTQWVVFEPNDDKLWARVTDTIRLFLRGQWRLGALFGRTEAEAFFITCDRTTMTQDDILNGRLICEIGIAPVRPAEFVIFRIFQNTAEAQR